MGIGFGSKAVVNGDVTQVDLPAGRISGLEEARRVLAGVEGVAFIQFGRRDVVRHELVQRIVAAYTEFEAERDRGRISASVDRRGSTQDGESEDRT